MFDPALAAQDVMDAGRDFVPFIVVPKPGEIKHILDLIQVVSYTETNYNDVHVNTFQTRNELKVQGLTQVVWHVWSPWEQFPWICPRIYFSIEHLKETGRKNYKVSASDNEHCHIVIIEHGKSQLNSLILSFKIRSHYNLHSNFLYCVDIMHIRSGE